MKPTFWSDEKVGLLARDARLTFLGLISAMADDHGRLSGAAKIVRGAVYPFDEDVSTRDVEEHIEALANAGLIERYQVNGSSYIHIKNWSRHQRVDKPSPSLLPEPPHTVPRVVDEGSQNIRGAFPTEGSVVVVEGSGTGKEAERDGDCMAAPLAPLVRLPRNAQQLVERFYPFASNRRLEVIAQLYLTLESAGRGAKVRRGEYVKARDPEHLDRVCAAVLDDPPNRDDLAIVWVLRKLQDPLPGPSPTEVAKKQEDARRQQEEAYQAAMRTAGLQWSTEHPEEYEQIRAAVDAQYKGQSGSFVKLAREAELSQKCARSAGFPSFDDWIRRPAA